MYYNNPNRTRTTTQPQGTVTGMPGTSVTPGTAAAPGTQTLPPLAPPMVSPGVSGTGIGTGPAYPLPGPPPVTDKMYIPGYLATLIGRHVRAEFMLGTNTFQDRTGILTTVGVNYFVLHDENFNIDIMCDLYSVRFVATLK